MKYLKSFFLLYFALCFINTNAQKNTSLEALKGIWVRQDIIQSLQNTHSIFETREILEKEKTAEFLTIAIPEKSHKKDSLMLCIGSFFTQMPLDMHASKNEKNKDGYYLAKNFWGKESSFSSILLFFKIKNDELEVILKNTQTQKTNNFTFQKVSNEKDNICFGQIHLSYFYTIAGNYRLLDGNGKILNENIRFDEKGNTNFPQFSHFNIYAGWGSSINNGAARGMGDKVHVQEKTEAQKRAMLKEGAIDKEDLLILRKYKENNLAETQQFIIQKTSNGFHIYSLKEEYRMKWQLLYKKDLIYKLERKE